MPKKFQMADTKRLVCALVLASALLPISSAFAAGLVPCGGQGEPTCTWNMLMELGKRIINFLLFTIAVPLAALLVAYGGMLMLISGTNPGNVNKGKTIIYQTLISLAIAFLAWLIVNTLLGVLTQGKFGLQTRALPVIISLYNAES